MSEGNYPRQPDQSEEEAPSIGRSFVVVREKRPNYPSALSVFPKSGDANENVSSQRSESLGNMSRLLAVPPEIPRRSSRRLSHV